MTLGTKAVECAKLRVGTAEVTPNYSPAIKIWLAFTGIFYPAPWCSSFAAAMIHNAASILRVKARWPRSASVQYCFNWCEKRGLVAKTPHEGDAFVIWNNELNRYAHIGLIAEVIPWNKTWKIHTVEGNSNSTGAREGTAVVSNWRVWSGRYRSLKIV
jgi:hypothetical protein